MRALCIDRRPGIHELDQVLTMRDAPVPEPGRDQVCVKIAASSINIDDLHIAEGTMFGGFPVAPKPSREHPWIPGTDLAGTIHSVGPGVVDLVPGQPVYGMRPPKCSGPWAEYGITKASFVAPMPEALSPAEAAAQCLGGVVACSILKATGSVRGKRCLVVGASGGIGTLMVQILASEGAEVWGVCSGKNRALVEGLGATRALDYQQGSFGTQLSAQVDHVDVILDFVGGREIQREGRAVTRIGGCFVTVVGPEKHVGERRLSVTGLAMMLLHIGWRWLTSKLRGPRYLFVGPLAPDFAEMDRLIVARGIRPVIDRCTSFDEKEVHEAIRYVRSHRSKGKVVITTAGVD